MRASGVLEEHLAFVEEWLANWRLNVNEQKCKHVTFSLRPKMCEPIKLNNIPWHSFGQKVHAEKTLIKQNNWHENKGNKFKVTFN